jgi:uncharacterized protein
VLNGSAPVGIPWPSLLAFLRILANLPRRGEALVDHGPLAASNDRLTVENVWIPTHHERHVQILASLLPLAATHLLAADAYLATLAIEHSLTLDSTDGDFARLPGLRWANPLAIT